MVDNAFTTRQDGGYSRAVRAPSALDIAGRNLSMSMADAIDVARYINHMASQLEEMAIAARLDLLAYFLNMAKAESDLFVRLNAQENVKSDVIDDLDFTGAI
jgi:hypothetical protein